MSVHEAGRTTSSCDNKIIDITVFGWKDKAACINMLGIATHLMNGIHKEIGEREKLIRMHVYFYCDECFSNTSLQLRKSSLERKKEEDGPQPGVEFATYLVCQHQRDALTRSATHPSDVIGDQSVVDRKTLYWKREQSSLNQCSRGISQSLKVG